MIQDQINQLKIDVAKFESFKIGVEKKQLEYPLDKKSVDAVYKDIVVPTGGVIIPAGLVSFDESIEVDINGKKYLLETTSEF